MLRSHQTSTCVWWHFCSFYCFWLVGDSSIAQLVITGGGGGGGCGDCSTDPNLQFTTDHKFKQHLRWKMKKMRTKTLFNFVSALSFASPNIGKNIIMQLRRTPRHSMVNIRSWSSSTWLKTASEDWTGFRFTKATGVMASIRLKQLYFVYFN